MALKKIKCWDCWLGIRSVPGCMGSSSEQCDTCDGRGNYYLTGDFFQPDDPKCPRCGKDSVLRIQTEEASGDVCFNRRWGSTCCDYRKEIGMTRPCPADPLYRWAQLDEILVPGACAWYDEDPSGTNWPPGFDPPPVGGVLSPPFSWLQEAQRKRDHDWPSDAHGLCGVIVRLAPETAPAVSQPDSPFRFDDDIPEPVKIKIRPQAVKALLEEVFPGALITQKDRIGGRAFKIKVWRFQVEISVTLEAMTETDQSGDATLTFCELPKDVKGQKPVILSQFTSGHLPDVKEGTERARQHVMGIVQAITKACKKPPEAPPVNIFGPEG